MTERLLSRPRTCGECSLLCGLCEPLPLGLSDLLSLLLLLFIASARGRQTGTVGSGKLSREAGLCPKSQKKYFYGFLLNNFLLLSAPTVGEVGGLAVIHGPGTGFQRLK